MVGHHAPEAEFGRKIETRLYFLNERKEATFVKLVLLSEAKRTAYSRGAIRVGKKGEKAGPKAYSVLKCLIY